MEAKAATDAIIGDRQWTPQDGPQSLGYFSKADQLLYGGAAGGGKSDLLVGWALNEAENSVIFRNGLTNVRDLEERVLNIRGSRAGFNSQYHRFELGRGRSLEFASLHLPDSEKERKGKRRDFIGFDEVSEQMRDRVQFVMGWLGSVKDVRFRVIMATNPPTSDEGNWLIQWFAPWLDPLFPGKAAMTGELRWFVNDADANPIWVEGPGEYDIGGDERSTARSRTFIPAKLADNPILQKRGYRSSVEGLPEPLRSAMLHGDFMAARRDDFSQIVPSDWVRAAQARWTDRGRSTGPMIAVGVDVAQGGKDRTVLARLHAENWFDEPVIADGVDTRDGPAVAGLVVKYQRNGAPIGIDMTGGWGGDARTQMKQSGIDVVPLNFSSVSGAVDPDSKMPYKNLRAEMAWNMRRALNPHSGESIALPPGQRVLAEAVSMRWELRSGKIQVESKDEIRDRLGASPDIWDAIMMAWHCRARGMHKIVHRTMRPAPAYAADADPHAIDGYDR